MRSFTKWSSGRHSTHTGVVLFREAMGTHMKSNGDGGDVVRGPAMMAAVEREFG